MKCVNCGADYSVNQLNCPFCHAENPEGLKRINEKKRRWDLFNALRLKTILNAGPIIVTRVLTRILLICIGIFGISIAGVILVLWVNDLSARNTNTNRPLTEHVINLEKIKLSGEYHKLSDYLGDNDLSRYDGVEEYWQLYDIHEDLLAFRRYRDYAEHMTKEKISEDPFTIETLLSYACKIEEYDREGSGWTKLYDGNKGIYEDYMEEVRAGLMVTCGFTKEEVEKLFAPERLYSDYYDDFVPIAVERMLKHDTSK